MVSLPLRPAWAALCAAAVVSSSPAALVVYEGFDYGVSSQSLNGLGGSTLGLTGSYAVTTVGSPTADYDPSGLTFGALQVTGGRAFIDHAGTNPTSLATASRQLDTGVLTGTVYGSFLFQQPTAHGGNDVPALLFGPNGATDNTAELSFSPDAYTSGTGSGNDIAQIRANPSNSGSPPYSANAVPPVINAPGTNVTLALFQISDLGATEGTQTAQLWLLTVDQFAFFKPEGLSAAELDAATVGFGSSNVLERVSLTIEGSSGYVTLGDAGAGSNFLSLYGYRGDISFDEIRLSTSSLDEVTPVPEPATTGLVLGVGLVFLARRIGMRRRAQA